MWRERKGYNSLLVYFCFCNHVFFFKIDRCAVLLFQRVKGQKSQRVLIPEAAHRETVSLTVVGSGGIAEIVIQVAVPGVRCKAL